MRVPFVFLLISLAGTLVAFAVPGWSDLLLLAGPSAVASLLLWLLAWRRRPVAGARWILIDGSNVMYWNANTPQIDTLRAVIVLLSARGFIPCVVFDANAGYLLVGKYQHDQAFGAALGLPADRVMVVPRGEPADPALLAMARSLGAPIVTNDRYRDWAEAHPEVLTPGHLIRGGYRAGRLWLDLESLDEKGRGSPPAPPRLTSART